MQVENRSSYLLKNTIIFALGNFGTKFITFFLVPFYTSALTTAEYGVIDLIYTVGMVLVPVLTLNISEAVLRFPLDKDADTTKIMSIGLIYTTIALIISICIFPFLVKMHTIGIYAEYMVLYMVSLMLHQLCMSYLRGKELLLQYAIGNIVHANLVASLNIYFLAICDKGIEGYLLAYVIANVVVAIYAAYYGNIINVIRNFSFDRKLALSMVKYSAVLIPNSFMWWIMNSADRIMISTMVGVAANGIYAVSYKLPTLLTTVSSVFNQAWSYSAIKENDSVDKKEYNNIVYDRLVSVIVLLSMGLLVILKDFLKIYVSNEYYEAWLYIPILIVGFVFMTLGSFVATSYTVYKDSRGFLCSGTVGAIGNLVLNWVLIPQINVMGAAIATATSYFIVFVYRVLDTKKYLELDVLKKKHVYGYILLMLAIITIYFDNKIAFVLLIVELLLTIVNFRQTVFAVWDFILNKINR